MIPYLTDAPGRDSGGIRQAGVALALELALLPYSAKAFVAGIDFGPMYTRAYVAGLPLKLRLRPEAAEIGPPFVGIPTSSKAVRTVSTYWCVPMPSSTTLMVANSVSTYCFSIRPTFQPAFANIEASRLM